MILIDSSVWVYYFRGSKEVVPKVLNLLDLNQIILADPILLRAAYQRKKKRLSTHQASDVCLTSLPCRNNSLGAYFKMDISC